jgi:hypothetical protein
MRLVGRLPPEIARRRAEVIGLVIYFPVALWAISAE